MYPRLSDRKRFVLAVPALAVSLVLAGCGGGGGGGAKQTSTETTAGTKVIGPGFTVSAPPSWHVSHAGRAATIKPAGEGPALASVTQLQLRTSYKPTLFPKVSKELDGVTAALAAKLDGKVIARRTVIVSAIRSRQYDLAYEKSGTGLVDWITYVLRGKREYYVLCRWPADEGDPGACAQLQASFKAG